MKLSLEMQERHNAEKLSIQVDRHIDTLKRLRSRLEQRAEEKSRHDEFRERKRNFAVRKEAILSGKVYVPEKTSSPVELDGIFDENKVTEKNELSVVLDSLNRLSALETRIRGLESENALNDPLPPNLDKPVRKVLHTVFNLVP